MKCQVSGASHGEGQPTMLREIDAHLVRQIVLDLDIHQTLAGGPTTERLKRRPCLLYLLPSFFEVVNLEAKMDFSLRLNTNC